MSKAAKALRRSGVRIKSLAAGHTALNIVISDLSSLRQRMKDSVSAQEVALESVDKWAQADELPALQDVMHQVFELNQMWTETQGELITQMKEYKRVYEHILEMEKKLDHAKKTLSQWEDKEKKLQKELSKNPKDIAEVQQKLEHATNQKEFCVVDVRCLEYELKVVKMMSVKAGLLDLSQTMTAVGERMAFIGKAQHDLAALIPETSERSETLPTYTGARDSSRILFDTKSKLRTLLPPTYRGATSQQPPSYSSVTRSESFGTGIKRYNSAPTKVKVSSSYSTVEDPNDSFESD